MNELQNNYFRNNGAIYFSQITFLIILTRLTPIRELMIEYKDYAYQNDSTKSAPLNYIK
jgi:hypothetical protein